MSTLIDAPAATRHVHPKKEAGCGCGCGGEPEPRCCELECQVRPNFFCGQLLNDTDLTQLVTWVRSRLSLQRYRDGWGVACGLNVECVPYDPCNKTRGPSVTVSPGYAIDCCGRDLVLCEPMLVDLSPFCAPLDDPCVEPTEQARRVRGLANHKSPQVEVTRKEGESDCELFFRVSRENALRINLVLRYGETLSGGTRTALGVKCGDSSGCRYTRIEERPSIVPVLVDREDTIRSQETELQKAVKELLEVIPNTTSAGALLRLLENEKYRPTSLCFIPEYLRCIQRPRSAEGQWQPKAISWILLDWILRHLRCPCAPCRTDEGVLLAQVWLIPAESRPRANCQVFVVYQQAPYRRHLQRDCPTPISLGDLSSYIGRKWSQALHDDLSKARGVESQAIELEGLQTKQVRDFFSNYRLVPPNDLKTSLYTLEIMGERHIAGFGPPQVTDKGSTGAKI